MRTRPFTLPENDLILLRDRYQLNLNAQEIAAKYGVTRSAVSKRFNQMNRPFKDPRIVVVDALPWKIVREHRVLDGAARLRAHIKAMKGDELPSAAQKRLDNWWKRLRRDRVVLDYHSDQPSPWVYVRRVETDGDLVIRWPASSRPTAEQARLLSLPAEPAEDDAA